MADIRIKDLAAFSGTPAANDFLAIEGPNETKKIRGDSFALNSKVDYMINEIKSTPAGTSKIIISDIPPAEIGGTGLGNEEYFKRTVKKLCEVYPNKSDTLFVGRGRPDSQWFYEICIYNTSEVNSEGLPRYSFGRAIKLNGMVCEAVINDFAWTWRENNDFTSTFFRYTPADVTQNPNPRQSYGLLTGVDKNRKTLTTIITSKETDGRTGSYLGVHNTDANGNPISNYFVIFLTRDGEVTYTVPYPANFRSAIDVGGQFITEKKSTTVNDATNQTDYTLTIDCTKQGYTPIGIVGVELAGEFYTRFHVAKYLISGNNAYVVVRSEADTSFTTPQLIVGAFVLYRRNA